MVSKLSPDKSILALDVGDARIGVARAGAFARLPEPLETIANDDSAVSHIKRIVDRENAGLLVIGIPRNMKGEETKQSAKIRDFAKKLDQLGIGLRFVDESLSSRRADEYLAGSKKSKGTQDSVAACFILEEFFTTMESIA